MTNLPVRVGETVVPGVQNSAASTIMTIADMSLITAEVKVDETDIVNVHSARRPTSPSTRCPNSTFTGHVIEIGNTAILRSSGLAASQSATSSQEAKDFKVVVALDSIRRRRFGRALSCTAKIITATRRNVLTIPIQALTVRKKGDLDPPKDRRPGGHRSRAQRKRAKKRFRACSWSTDGKAEFRKVETGITGATDIEVLSGLNEGDQIVTGSYKVIRTIRNAAPVKVDNRIAGRRTTKQLEWQTQARYSTNSSAASSSSATASSSAPGI